jgi:hypothetical protein
MRYQYARFDFSTVREPGIYAIEYAGQRTGPFRIAKNVYDGIWRPSLETYLPEQMDHVKVREGYRIWHGASHPDDARQAPVNYTHFDGYQQGPTTESPFSPGQHIPGLNVGGWYDAGDFDLRGRAVRPDAKTGRRPGCCATGRTRSPAIAGAVSRDRARDSVNHRAHAGGVHALRRCVLQDRWANLLGKNDAFRNRRHSLRRSG